jgi:hypothetical protein
MSGRTRDRIHRNVFAKGFGMFGVIIFDLTSILLMFGRCRIIEGSIELLRCIFCGVEIPFLLSLFKAIISFSWFAAKK